GRRLSGPYMTMRLILFVLLALAAGRVPPAGAQGTPVDGRRPMADMLPLFAKNGCAELKDTADQMFCGDPDLNPLGGQLGKAVEGRLSRLPDRRAAIEE